MNNSKRRKLAKGPKTKRNTSELPYYAKHLGEHPPHTRMPRNDQEMRDHLSSMTHTPHLRGPVNREERREWARYWTLRGKGFTKPGTKAQTPRRWRKSRQKLAAERRRREAARDVGVAVD